MNATTFIRLLLIYGFAVTAHAWTLPVGSFQFEKLAPGVYVMHGPLTNPSKDNRGFMNNPAFIESKTGIILIDPGSTLEVGREVLREIRTITSKPVLAVFNTHIHGDHWLANHAIKLAFPDAPIYAHQNTIDQANDSEGLIWLDLMNQLTGGISKDTELTPANIPVKNGDLLEIDGEHFRIRSVIPSSTNTDIMVEHVESKTLFLGDNSVVNRLARFDASSSILGNIDVLELINRGDFEVIVPGHGPSGSKSVALQPYLNYLKKLKLVVEQGLEDELEDYEIKQASIEKFSDIKGWVAFDERFGVNLNKMYLELEAF